MADSNSPWVLQVDDGSFDREVLERSHQTPVIVDFWASWCQPCLMLAPVLEKLAGEGDGKWVLAKAETDHNQEAAERYGVQSIPAVFAFLNGEVIDGFAGLLPEEQLVAWLEGIAGQGRLLSAKSLETSDPAAAQATYEELLAEDPNHAEASIGLARVRLAQGDRDGCQAILAELERRGFLEPEAERLKASLNFSGEAVDLDSLRQAAEARADDYAAQLALAEGLAAAQQYEEALQRALEIVRQDRHGAGDAARQLMVNVFRLLPDDSELTQTYRRQLSMALY